MRAKRPILDIAILLSIIFLPYWIYVPLAVLGIVLVPFFWEAVLFGFLAETLYGSGRLLSVFTLGPFFLVVAIMVLRDRLRFNV